MVNGLFCFLQFIVLKDQNWCVVFLLAFWAKWFIEGVVVENSQISLSFPTYKQVLSWSSTYERKVIFQVIITNLPFSSTTQILKTLVSALRFVKYLTSNANSFTTKENWKKKSMKQSEHQMWWWFTYIYALKYWKLRKAYQISFYYTFLLKY